jgi:hypothetical protein
MLETWQTTLRAALLGIERLSSPLTLGTQHLHVAPADAPSEQHALHAAAQLAPLMRAGYVPQRRTVAAAEVPAERWPIAPDRAVAGLAITLRAPHPRLTIDWCTLAQQRGFRAPGHLLPALLAVFHSWPKARRAALASVLGEGGAWVAAQHPVWQTMLNTSTDATLWEAGTTAQRIEVLRGIRARTPEVARGLLEQAREHEPPDSFAAMLALLGAQLSMADESFLEGLLDAKHKPVRTAAQSLLSQLPDSRYANRMADRLLPLLRFSAAERGLIFKKKAKLSIALPNEPDKPMVRDGMDGKRQFAELGRRAYTLAQLFAGTPLMRLSQGLQIEPDAFVTAVIETDEATAVLYGLSEAVLTQGDQTWCRAVLTALEGRDAVKHQAVTTESETRMVALIEPSEREAALRVRAQGAALPQWLAQVSEAAPHAWSAEFSDWVVQTLMQHGKNNAWLVNNLAETIAVQSHPRSARASLKVIQQLGDDWPAAWQTLAHLVELRLRYAEELLP